MRATFLPATALLCCSILGSGIPTLAQNRQYNNSQFYNGANRGVRGGNYGKPNNSDYFRSILRSPREAERQRS